MSALPVNSSIDLHLTKIEEQAIELLGQNLELSIIASAVGVTVSRISQIATSPEFQDRINSLRYQNLLKHNQRDEQYDDMEDVVMKKLKESIPTLYKHRDILSTIKVLNEAKRRGTNASALPQQPVQATATIQMPTIIANTFTTNVVNQVVKAGDQDLVTIQSGNMEKLLASSKSAQTIKEIYHVLPSTSTTESTSSESSSK